MRIDLNSASLGGVEREENTKKPSGKASGASRTDDKASLSVDTVSIAALTTQALAAPQVRQDRVDALRQAIQSGQYQVDPSQIAQAMLAQNKR